MIDGVLCYFRKAHVSIQIVEYDEKDIYVARLLNFWKPDGCIVEASWGLPAELFPQHFRSTPVVYLDQCPRDLGAPILEVRNDENACGLAAAKELLSDEIVHYAFVEHPKFGLDWSRERGDAFLRTIRLHNQPCSRFDMPNGRKSRKHALRQWLLELPKPCGIFAANDFTAEEVISVGVAAGIGFPKDIRLVGLDNDEQICLRTKPTITSLWPDYERGGFLCAKTLAQKWENPRMRKSLMLYGLASVIRRESSVNSASADFHVLSAINVIRNQACDSDFSVENVALAMGCSRRSAEQRFKISTGHTIRDEIQKTRFERVFALLSTHATPIEAIASRCGFGTSAALRTAFRKRTGRSLRDWRKEHCH